MNYPSDPEKFLKLLQEDIRKEEVEKKQQKEEEKKRKEKNSFFRKAWNFMICYELTS